MRKVTPQTMYRRMGLRLRRARTAKGYGIEFLANVSGIGATRLDRYEHGLVDLDAVELLYLAKLLDIPTWFLFEVLQQQCKVKRCGNH